MEAMGFPFAFKKNPAILFPSFIRAMLVSPFFISPLKLDEQKRKTHRILAVIKRKVISTSNYLKSTRSEGTFFETILISGEASYDASPDLFYYFKSGPQMRSVPPFTRDFIWSPLYHLACPSAKMRFDPPEWRAYFSRAVWRSSPLHAGCPLGQQG